MGFQLGDGMYQGLGWGLVGMHRRGGVGFVFQHARPAVGDWEGAKRQAPQRRSLTKTTQVKKENNHLAATRFDRVTSGL